MNSHDRKPRPTQIGIETDLAANPAARQWLHDAMAALMSYSQILAELEKRFGIKRSMSRLSAYYHRHASEIGQCQATTATATVPASSPAFAITITAPGATAVSVLVRPILAGKASES